MLVPLGWNGLLMTCSLGLGLVHLRGDCLANLMSAQPLQLPRGQGRGGLRGGLQCSVLGPDSPGGGAAGGGGRRGRPQVVSHGSMWGVEPQPLLPWKREMWATRHLNSSGGSIPIPRIHSQSLSSPSTWAGPGTAEVTVNPADVGAGGNGASEREGGAAAGLEAQEGGEGAQGTQGSLRDPLWAWLSWVYPLNAGVWSAGLQRSWKPERVGEEWGGKKMLPTPGSRVRGPSLCRCPLFHVWEKSLSAFASPFSVRTRLEFSKS